MQNLRFPIVEAWAMTVHKSQDITFDKVVFHYERGLEQQLVYLGLSRVTFTHGTHLKKIQLRQHVPSLEKFQ
jgi:hypothetical protein